jgi:hypothetical protein
MKFEYRAISFDHGFEGYETYSYISILSQKKRIDEPGFLS